MAAKTWCGHVHMCVPMSPCPQARLLCTKILDMATIFLKSRFIHTIQQSKSINNTFHSKKFIRICLEEYKKIESSFRPINNLLESRQGLEKSWQKKIQPIMTRSIFQIQINQSRLKNLYWSYHRAVIWCKIWHDIKKLVEAGEEENSTGQGEQRTGRRGRWEAQRDATPNWTLKIVTKYSQDT